MVTGIQVQSPFDNFSTNNHQTKSLTPSVNNKLDKDVYEKQEKKDTKNNSTQKKSSVNGWQKVSTIANCVFAGSAAVYVFALLRGRNSNALTNNAKKFAENIYTDLTKEKNLQEMVLPKELEGVTDNILNVIRNPYEVYQKGGGEGMRSLLLYGVPGTGKTTYAKAIAKEINADFVELDIAKMKDRYVGSTEQNLHARIDKICEDAALLKEDYELELSKIIGEDLVKSGDKSKIQEAIEIARNNGIKTPELKRIVVFVDEIDTVMMVDSSGNQKISNDILNEFKKVFTERLGKYDNVITIGATNLEIDAAKSAATDGKMLDKPMLDRFAMKVRVPSPDKNQIKDVISSYYKNLKLVDDNLKHKDSAQLETLADVLQSHNVSFRNIRDILETTGRNPNVKKVTISDIKQTIKDMREQLKISDAELEKIV